MSPVHLYAYPDVDVVDHLLPAAKNRYVSRSQALRRIQRNPGLIPIAIDPGHPKRIYWADFGERAFNEWQFMYSIQKLAQDEPDVDAFVSDFDVLLEPDLVSDQVPLLGFIFHISRCGSTLLGKALAREDAHVVVNQGGPLQRGFWAGVTEDWRQPLHSTPDNLAMFRRLVLAMSRRRRPGERAAFVKFISWNTLYIDFIRKAFPNVPCLFMYRDPVEVIASVRKETTAALVNKNSRQASFLTGLPPTEISLLDDTTYLAHCFARYFDSALMADKPPLLLNYKSLSQSSFHTLLQMAFGYSPSKKSTASMLRQFKYHSKDDSDQTNFVNDSQNKQSEVYDKDRRTITQITGRFYRRLELADANFCNTQRLLSPELAVMA